HYKYKRNIHLPAAILSDADGQGITSWYPYPTTQSDCTYTFAPHSPSPFFSTFAGEGAAVVPPQSGRVKFVAASFALRPLASPLGYNIAAYPVTVAHNITIFVNSIPSSIDTTSMLASTYVDAIQLTRMGTYLSDAGYVLHLDGFPATLTSSVTEEISRSRSYGSQTPTPSMSLSQRTMSASNTSSPTVSRTPWTLTVAITPTIPRTSPSTTLSSSRTKPTVSRTPWTLTVAITPTIPRTSPSTTLSSSRTKTASESSSKSISSTRESVSKSSTATGDCPQRSLKLFDILFGSVVLSTGIDLRNGTSANNNNTNINTSVPMVVGGLLSAQTGDKLRGDSLFQCSLCSQQLFLRNLSSTTSACNGSRLKVNSSTTNSPEADDDSAISSSFMSAPSTILSSVMSTPLSQYVMFGPSGSDASIVVDRTAMLKQHAATSSSTSSMTSVLSLRALFSFEHFASLSARAQTSTTSSSLLSAAAESGVTIHAIVRGVEVAARGVTVVPATTTAAATVSQGGSCLSSSDVESSGGGDTITDPSRYSCCQFADAGARTQWQWFPLHVQLDPSTLSALTWSDPYVLRVRVPLALVDCGVANTVPLPRNSTRDFTTTTTTSSGNTTTSATTTASAFTIDIRFIASAPAKDISGIVSVGTVGSVAATSAALAAFTGSPTFAITTARVATLRALMACSFNGQVDSSGDASAIISNAASGINVTSWLLSTYSLKLSNAIELAQLDSILNWDIGAGGATTPNSDNVNGLDQQLVIAYGNTIRGGVIGNMVLLGGFLATYILATVVVLFGMVWKRFHDGQQHHRPFVIAFRTVFLENPLDVLYQWSGAVHAAGVFCLPLSVLLIPTVQLLVKQFWELTAPAVDGVVSVVTLLVLVWLVVKWLYTLLPLRGESREKENNNSSSSGILDGPFACKVVRYSLVDRTMLWDRFNLSWDRVVYSLRHCARRPADDVTVNDDEGDVGIQRYEKAKPLYSLPEAPSTLLQFFRSSLRGATYFAFCPQQHWIAIRAVAVVEPGAGEDHHAEGTKASPTNPAPLKHHHGAQVVGARLVAAGGGSSVTTTHRRIWKRQHLFCFSEFRILAVIRWELFMSIVIALANGIVQSYLLHHNDTSSSSLCLIPIIILVINYAVSIAVYFILWPSFVPAVNALTLSTNICGLAAGVAAVLAVQYTNNVSVSSNAADVTMMALLLISCIGYIRSAMDLMSVFTGVMHAWGTLSRLADLLISRAVSRQLTAGGGGNSSSVETPLALNVVDLCQLDDGGVQLVSSDDDGDNETGDDDDDHDKSLDGTPTQLNGSFLTFSPLSPGGLHREDSTGAAGSTSNSFIGIPHSDVTGVGNKSLVSANDLERAYKKGGQQLPATAAALLQQRNAASKGGQRESTKQRAENRMSPRAASMEDSLQRSQLSVNGSFAFRLDVDDDDL
ncbi:transmembrane protein, putative, partial [Bodo saltans]